LQFTTVKGLESGEVVQKAKEKEEDTLVAALITK
jgi:hypothetical protein